LSLSYPLNAIWYKDKEARARMPLITINFIGPLRIIAGVRSVSVNVNHIDEAREYVVQNYGVPYEKKLKSTGGRKKSSIWDDSHVLLNGQNIQGLNAVSLKDGDRLDLLSKIAGG
jgi:molybdopterin converting factor small subunit